MYEELFELHAQLLKALAHPRRLEIINLLRDQKLCVSDIYEMLDLPQANISQHLTVLRDAGVLTTTRDGKQIIYQLANPQVLAACDLLRQVVIEQHQDTLLAGPQTFNMMELVPLVHDPVCQMRVSPKTAANTAHFEGQTYYFCASGCFKKFTQKPEKYART